MENATKALLIAAAVLVAILIISLGLVVYNQASETVDSVNMSAQETQAFNDQFLKYDGKGKRGTEVNALLTAVLTNNMSIIAESDSVSKATSNAKYITVKGATVDATNGKIDKKDSGKVYDVTVERDSKTGLVHTITITEKK